MSLGHDSQWDGNSRQPHPSQDDHPRATTWLEAIVDISRQIANLQDLSTVLDSIVTLATELVDADAAAVTLLNHNQSQLTIHCFTGKHLRDGNPATCDTINSSMTIRAIKEGQVLCFPKDSQPDESVWYCPLLGQRVQAAAIVPLRLDDVSIGALVVVRHEQIHFTVDEVNGLSYLADQAVIALEHGSMTSRIQSLAIVEERYRIAREMHDSLAQVLGYLNVQMQTLELLVHAGDTQRVLEELTTAKQSIRVAQDDVRDSILSLRTTLSDDLPLSLALQEYVMEFGVQTGLDAHFESDGVASPSITPLANVEVVRIVQEALANVRKHAQASTVRVNLVTQQGTLKITVCDDGVGFDTAALQRSHFGLVTMSERAQQVGGKIMITSRPGIGTTVELKVPLTLQV